MKYIILIAKTYLSRYIYSEAELQHSLNPSSKVGQIFESVVRPQHSCLVEHSGKVRGRLVLFLSFNMLL